jgi:TolA-binding protein
MKIRLLLIILLSVFLSACNSKEKMIEKIEKAEAKLMSDSLMLSDTTKAVELFRDYIKFADTYNGDTLSAAYLFKAGDLAMGIHRPQESVNLYERLIISYPTYRRTAAALFMQAFVYETALNDKEKAKLKYKEFIDKYPNHALTPSAHATLEQLNSGLTDEELIRQFEANIKEEGKGQKA